MGNDGDAGGTSLRRYLRLPLSSSSKDGPEFPQAGEEPARTPAAPAHAPEGLCTGFESEAFDAANELEQGLATDGNRLVEAATHVPRPGDEQFERCCILHQDNSDEYRLVSEDLNLLCVARHVATEHRIEFFFQPEADAPGSEPGSPLSANGGRAKPAYTMTYNTNADEWTLVQSKCDCCSHRPRHFTCEYLGKGQQMAIIRHSRRRVGKAMVHHVDLFMPPLLGDTGSAIWCPAWTGRDLTCRVPAADVKIPGGAMSPSRAGSKVGSLSPAKRVRLPEDTDEPIRLHTKLPVWDPELDHLVLDFTELNRRPSPSPRNFMLTSGCPAEDGLTLCQHAAIGGNTWCLDFKHPLNVVQAFAVAMSSINWE